MAKLSYLFFLAISSILILVPLGFAQEASLARVRISYPSMSMALLPAMTVVEKGFDRKEGLWVELIQARPSVSTVGLMSGDIDFDVGIPSAVQAAVSQGLPLKVIFVANEAPLFTFMAQRDIKSLVELRGRNVAVTAMGGATHLITQTILERHGLNLGTDVRVIAIGGGMPAVFSSLKARNIIDGALVSLPWQIRLEREGFKALAEAGDYIRFPTNGLVAKADKVQREMDKVRRAVRAHVRALAYLRSEYNNADILAHIMKQFKVDDDVAMKSLKIMRAVWSENGIPSKKGVEQILRLSSSASKVSEILDRIVDASIASAVKAQER